MCSRRAIHFRLIVVSRRKRRASTTLTLSPLRQPGKSSSFQPRRRSSSRRMRPAFSSPVSRRSAP